MVFQVDVKFSTTRSVPSPPGEGQGEGLRSARRRKFSNQATSPSPVGSSTAHVISQLRWSMLLKSSPKSSAVKPLAN